MPGHVPVLLSEVLTHLHLQSNEDVIDATLGGGGHAAAMLEAVAPNGRLLGIETDPRTLVATRTQLRRFGSRFVPAHGNFRQLRRLATDQGFRSVDAILFDLGLSSLTIDDPSRGFSFQHDGPLDMRFDPTDQTPTAAEIIDTWSGPDLERIFRSAGEERQAARIAAAIVAKRRQAPLTTTGQLTELISAVKPRRGRLHPATQVFQALRLTVNDELGALESALPQALELLRPGGRLAVITFHSLEDRVAKRWSHQEFRQGRLRLVNRHVIVPARQEQLANPRSRSAKLRLVEKT